MKKLPTKYQKIYKENYIEYAGKNSIFRKIVSIFESWYHNQASSIYPSADKILDVGSGSLFHLKFESNYKIYDIVEPKKYLLDNCPKELLKIQNYYENLKDIPIESKYDKILSIMVLEHVEDLDLHLKLISQKINNSGKFIVEISAQNDFLYWLSWRCSTGFIFWLKYRLDYGVLMNFERLNSYEKILKTIKKYFLIIEKKAFPFNIRNFRIYEHLVCIPKKYN